MNILSEYVYSGALKIIQCDIENHIVKRDVPAASARH